MSGGNTTGALTDREERRRLSSANTRVISVRDRDDLSRHPSARSHISSTSGRSQQRETPLVNLNFYPPDEAAADFVGCEEMLERLQYAFFPEGQPVNGDRRKSFVIYGMGGSGKTQLASVFAQRNKQRWVHLSTPPSYTN